MSTFLWNLALALLWAAVMGSVSAPSLLVGFALGFVLLAWVRPEPERSPYGLRALRLVELLARVLWEVVEANLRVAWDVVTPTMHSRPAIYRYEMEARTDAEVTLLALIVTFTPGTLGLEVSQDGRALYVHAMFAEERAVFSARLRTRVERPLLRVLR